MPKLYVVATPIGNLSDASPRMVETLGQCGLIAAEDTRVTGNLLRHFGLKVPMVSCHRHNESERSEGILNRILLEGIDAALVTDAGTPCISDPGYILVREAVESGIDVIPVPGPTAMASALSICGFDTKEFAFYGFLPRVKSDLKKKLLEISQGPQVAVLHESPHRVTELMEVVAQTLENCQACVCCDLTKLYEKTVRGTAQEVALFLKNDPKTEKGEYCVVLDFSQVPKPEKEEVKISMESRLLEKLLSGMDMRDAVSELTQSGEKSNDVKKASLRIKKWLQEQQD